MKGEEIGIAHRQQNNAQHGTEYVAKIERHSTGVEEVRGREQQIFRVFKVEFFPQSLVRISWLVY